MTISYRLTADDHLTFLLYLASKSDRIRKKRFILRIVFPGIYIFLGILAYYNSNFSEYSGLAGFCALSALWYVFYPKWESRYYVRQYKAFVKEYDRRDDEFLTLETDDHFLLIKDDSNEGKISTDEIESLDEIPALFFLMLKGSSAIIIPKNELSDPDHVRQELIKLTKRLHVPYVKNESWKWQ